MNLDRNIVIEASAGTGKTYTLVHAILQAMFQKNLQMDQLVALTFTKKAAGEMKERIAAELQKIDKAEKMENAWLAWGHTLLELKTKARQAFETIDRAAIGTIHSYCFSLLKRFPLAAGISPDAEVDDKNVRGDDLFEKEWPAWLSSELRAQNTESGWLDILQTMKLRDVRELARRLCDFDVPLEALPVNDGLALVTTLIKPFVSRFRKNLLAEGILSNNALLVLARELVATDLKVRETLKREIQMIFVDEFQDTDPLQGELLLFLAEKLGGNAKQWSDVILQPGKLFIVGDPKQSIYRFRGADIAAYQGITKLVLEQGGERLSLEESYRSHEQIIHLVNAAFTSLIEEKHPISPAYQALIPRRKRTEPAKELVELRLANSEEPQSSDEAVEKEAEDAAEWIVQAKAEGRWTYKDMALVFRSTPTMPHFVDKLRARAIPFVVEGERYFYRTPEVTDVLNLLRVIANPNDRISLVGALRSPLGGFTDREIVSLKESDWKLKSSSLMDLIRTLQARARHEPLKSVLGHVYEDTYLLELAAHSYHKDQTIANLLKLKRLMESFAEEGETSLAGLLTKIDRFMEDDRLEGESPLADETYDAVRLLTIHKAKGLEFPVVWLPGLHRGRQANRRGSGVKVQYDWSTKQLGISITKDLQNQTYTTLDEEGRAREEAEERRVLYVAMTRARDHLILSGGVDLKRPSKDAFLSQLSRAWGINLDTASDGEIKIGDGVLSVHEIIPPAEKTLTLPASTAGWLAELKPASFAKEWKERALAAETAMTTPLLITPSALASPGLTAPSPKGRGQREVLGEAKSFDPRQLGTLVHKFLETWDFSCEKCSMPLKLRQIANSYFASEGLLKEPFPDPKETDKTNNPPKLIAVVDEAQHILADFIGSEAEEEIKSSTILGREVPFFYKVDDALMRGTIDILYRTSNAKLVIGDYKTDKEHDESRYAAQALAYQQAVELSLGEKAQFKLIYLREGIPSQL